MSVIKSRIVLIGEILKQILHNKANVEKLDHGIKNPVMLAVTLSNYNQYNSFICIFNMIPLQIMLEDVNVICFCLFRTTHL